jgi:6-pyruvoyltetrahydropterin/6-carboxytetrahydropterin synthase
MVCRLTKDFFFEAAHSLPNVPESHKCRRIHGHSYRVEISVEGEVDPALGWLYDHSLISVAMKPIVDHLDHRYLNEVPGLENPTIENLCAWIWKQIEAKCPGLCEIVIYETPTVRCTYRGE